MAGEITPEQAVAAARARLRLQAQQQAAPSASPLATFRPTLGPVAPDAWQAAAEALGGPIDPAAVNAAIEDATRPRYSEEAYRQGQASHQIPVEPIPSYARSLDPQFGAGQVANFANGATFGLLNEIAGLGGGIGALFDPNATFAEGYDRASNAVLDAREYARNQDPGAATVAEIWGGGTSAAGLARGGFSLLNGARPTVASVAGRSALEGTAYGAAYGFGEGETLEDRIEGAWRGGAMGAAAGLVAGTAGGVLARRSASSAAGTALRDLDQPAIPATHPLRQQSTEVYEIARQGGVTLRPDAAQALRGRMQDAATVAGMTPDGTPIVYNIAQQLGRGAYGTGTGLDDLDVLREAIIRQTRNASDAERRVAERMLRELDEFVGTLAPASIAAGADPDATARVLGQLGTSWNAVGQAERVSSAFYRASNAGGNRLDAIRAEFRTLANDRAFMESLSEAERSAVLAVVRGKATERALSFIGRAFSLRVPFAGAGLGGGAGWLLAHAPEATGVAAAAGGGGILALGAGGRAGASALRRGQIAAADTAFRSQGGVLPSVSPALTDAVRATAVGGILGFPEVWQPR